MRVIDLGWGLGNPARNTVLYMGCEIVGVTNSLWNVERGTLLAKLAGMERSVTTVPG